MELEKLSLANVGEGSLELQFQAAYPQIIQALKDGGKKAVIDIKIEFTRPASTSTIAGIKTAFNVKMPPEEPRLSMYTFNGNDFKIEAEPAKPLGEAGIQNVLPFVANK